MKYNPISSKSIIRGYKIYWGEDMILIGFMGSGKTTVAKLLGAHMEREVRDLDEEIVKSSGMTIPEIFAAEGETGFRLREYDVLKALPKQDILATGGGVVTYAASRRLLMEMDQPIIYLHADFPTLYNRIREDMNRPLVKDKASVKKLYEERLDLYRSTSAIEIDATSTPKTVVDQIMQTL